MGLFFRILPSFTPLLAVLGCASPLSGPPMSKEAINLHAIASVEEDPGVVDSLEFPLEGFTKVEESLSGRKELLEKITPAAQPLDGFISTGVDLNRVDAVSIELSKQDAVLLAVQNNLDVEIASLQPAISSQSLVAARAAFDVVFGASVTTGRNRIPQQSVIGNPFSSNESETKVFQMDASLAKRLRGGGTLTLSTDVIKTENEQEMFQFSPNPAWQAIGKINLSQPLLRNFGETVSRSEIKLSTVVHGKSLEDFRGAIQTVITATDHAYLDLSLQWKILQVKQWLLEEGEHVVEILERRLSYDTGQSDYAQGIATVEQRRADMISQQALVHKASDLLKQLINTEEFPLESEVVIRPADFLNPTQVSISFQDAINMAMANRPDLQGLSYDIDTSEINMDVAENARLPQLDLQAQMSMYGLGNSASDGYQEVFDADFLNYATGLSYEVPLGNKALEAEFQSSRLQRMSSIATYRKGVQQAIIELKSSLRDIATNAELMQANRSYRVAQAENLRALQIEEDTMSGLTPTFLNLKLQTQNGLANARIAEFAATVNYNKAISSMFQATGSTLDMNQISFEELSNTESR